MLSEAIMNKISTRENNIKELKTKLDKLKSRLEETEKKYNKELYEGDPAIAFNHKKEMDDLDSEIRVHSEIIKRMERTPAVTAEIYAAEWDLRCAAYSKELAAEEAKVDKAFIAFYKAMSKYKTSCANCEKERREWEKSINRAGLKRSEFGNVALSDFLKKPRASNYARYTSAPYHLSDEVKKIQE